MYASVRQYRTNDTEEVARRVQGDGGFLPVVKEVPGFSAYYLIDGGDGKLITVTVADDQSGVEESVNKARDWVQENAAELIEGAPDVINGEVRAQA